MKRPRYGGGPAAPGSRSSRDLSLLGCDTEEDTSDGGTSQAPLIAVVAIGYSNADSIGHTVNHAGISTQTKASRQLCEHGS